MRSVQCEVFFSMLLFYSSSNISHFTSSWSIEETFCTEHSQLHYCLINYHIVLKCLKTVVVENSPFVIPHIPKTSPRRGYTYYLFTLQSLFCSLSAQPSNCVAWLTFLHIHCFSPKSDLWRYCPTEIGRKSIQWCQTQRHLYMTRQQLISSVIKPYVLVSNISRQWCLVWC